ncbi:hypothetical protein [Streptomyces mirabilis]
MPRRDHSTALEAKPEIGRVLLPEGDHGRSQSRIAVTVTSQKTP